MKTELIIGQSRLFRKTLEDIDKFAKSPWPVLITGETGVGKNSWLNESICFPYEVRALLFP